MSCAAGARVGCGKIGPKAYDVLIGEYPGVSAPSGVDGAVTVSEMGNKLYLDYQLTGLEAGVSGGACISLVIDTLSFRAIAHALGYCNGLFRCNAKTGAVCLRRSAHPHRHDVR